MCSIRPCQEKPSNEAANLADGAKGVKEGSKNDRAPKRHLPLRSYPPNRGGYASASTVESSMISGLPAAGLAPGPASAAAIKSIAASRLRADSSAAAANSSGRKKKVRRASRTRPGSLEGKSPLASQRQASEKGGGESVALKLPERPQRERPGRKHVKTIPDPMDTSSKDSSSDPERPPTPEMDDADSDKDRQPSASESLRPAAKRPRLHQIAEDDGTMGGGGKALPAPALAPPPSMGAGGVAGVAGGPYVDLGWSGAVEAGTSAKAKFRSSKSHRISSSAMDVDEAECSSGGSSPQTASSEDLGNEGDIEDHGEGGTSSGSESSSSGGGGGGRGGW